MSPELAKSIGVKKAFMSATIGVLVAYSMMVLFTGGDFFWIVDFYYLINIGVGLFILFGCAYFFGTRAGFEILIKKKNAEKVGAKYGILIILITAFLVGWAGFVQEGMEPNDTFWDSFEDYIFKPFFWIAAYGFLPSIIIGILFGKWIKKSESKIVR